MQGYKSLCAVVTMYAILVNIHTDSILTTIILRISQTTELNMQMKYSYILNTILKFEE